ncbi:MAG TPA: cysteine methyltransferase, partial [Phenylobacterium sp.]|nr:cysteine methyltransferase [Phenylobacterium sp.]
MISYTLFETAIGWAGLAWGDKGLVGAYLPEAERENARRSFLRRYPDAIETAPTEMVADAIAAIRELLTGQHTDLT